MATMQLAFDGRATQVDGPWPQAVPIVAGPKLFEVTFTQSTRIVVAASDRDDIDRAAMWFSPDFWSADADQDIWPLTGSVMETATHRLVNGRIEPIERAGDWSMITLDMLRDEIARRAVADYGYLTGPHAEDCALRDIQRDVVAGAWPSEEWLAEAGCGC